MINNIEEEVKSNREDRKLQNGPGAQLEQQVESKQNLDQTNEGQKFYRDKGINTSGGFNQLKMYRDGIDPQIQEDGSYVIPNQYVMPGTRSVFGYDPVDGKELENVNNTASMWGAPSRIVAGGFHDAAQGATDLGIDIAEGIGVDVSTVRENRASYQQPKWLDKSSGAVENMARSMAQYVGGWATLAKAGLKKTITKTAAASVGAGQTFNPADGTVVTLMHDLGMDKDVLRFLDSRMVDEEYGRFAARLSMAAEELIPGVGYGAGHKIAKLMRSQYRSEGKNLIKKGVMQYNNATGSINHPTLGSQGTQIMQQNPAEEAVNMIASGMHMMGSTVDKFMEQAKLAGIDDNVAKKAWNATAKQKLERVQSFLSPTPEGPIARQRGSIKLGQAADIADFNKVMDTMSVDKMFKKQVERGNIQKAEYDDVIKPTIDRMKEVGKNKVSGEQMASYIDMMRPTFKTIVKTDDARHSTYTYSPNKYKMEMKQYVEDTGEPLLERLKLTPTNIDVEGNMSVDYAEHLFIARNEKFEGPEGFVNKIHFDEPHIKGIARTNIFAKGSESAVNDSKKLLTKILTESTKKFNKDYDWEEMADYEFDRFVAGYVLDEKNIEKYITKRKNGEQLTSKEKFVVKMANDLEETAGEQINISYFVNSVLEDPQYARVLESIAPQRRIVNGKVFVQELQNDNANAARMFGEWKDEDLIPKIDSIMGDIKSMNPTNKDEFKIAKSIGKQFLSNQEYEGYVKKLNMYESIDKVDVNVFNSKEFELYKTMEKLSKSIGTNGISKKETFSLLRKKLATPSVFNEDKAWLRQSIRGVIEYAADKNVDTIVLASERIIAHRWNFSGAEGLYQGKYPKVLLQYFKEIGVPEKDIHMPSKGHYEMLPDPKNLDNKIRTYVPSAESFWVKLPQKVMDGAQKLPQYSIAGSAPITMKFGEENDK